MDILLTPLRRIPVPRGDVFHAIKASAPGFAGFGEAYFTTVETGAVKGWKRHREMTMNLVVPAGAVEFVLFDGEPGAEGGTFRSVTLSTASDESYQRLTVPPGLWMAFAGRGEGLNLVLNFASIEHRPDEADNRPLDDLSWNWER
jgi:dTDP-4-dehydrorhamnose 3,5-epimerase